MRAASFAAAAVALSCSCGCSHRQGGAHTPAARWSSLPPPPVERVAAGVVSTRRGLFYWGGSGYSNGKYFADGAIFDLRSRRWQRLPAAPIGGRVSPAAVWTGSEAIVWGGIARRPKNDGAAYDPATRTWHVLPRAPLSGRRPVAAVWTGRRLLVWGDTDRSTAARDGASFDPARRRWRRIAVSPFALNEASAAWTGGELVVVGALLDRGNHSLVPHARALAYDPRRDSWRVLPSPRLAPQASSIAWTGKEIVAWDYEQRAMSYDPARNEWRRLPNVPVHFSECYPQGTAVRAAVFAWFCGQAATFDPRSRTWQRVTVPRRTIGGVPVAARNSVLFAGSSYSGQPNGLWAYALGA